jgi:hypothetical protein
MVSSRRCFRLGIIKVFHIYGKGKTLNEDELEADLEQLLDKYEKIS